MRAWRISIGTLALPIALVIVFATLPIRPFSAAAQQAAPSSEAVLRTTTNLVQLSVIATDKTGQPVEDLTTDHSVILDNGHPQNIAFYRKERRQLPAHASAPLPPDTYTNQLSATGNVPASITMVLLDGLNTAPAIKPLRTRKCLSFSSRFNRRTAWPFLRWRATCVCCSFSRAIPQSSLQQ